MLVGSNISQWCPHIGFYAIYADNFYISSRFYSMWKKFYLAD